MRSISMSHYFPQGLIDVASAGSDSRLTSNYAILVIFAFIIKYEESIDVSKLFLDYKKKIHNFMRMYKTIQNNYSMKLHS